MTTEYYLHVSCPDASGLIATVTGAVAEAGANILDLRQHTAVDIDTFFLNALFEKPDADESFETTFSNIFSLLATRKNMEWSLEPKARKQRVALLVSKTSHCLYELLIKHRDGELDCEFPVIVSNHPDLAGVAAQFGVPFETVDTSKGKAEYEADLESILARRGIDLVVLARYMQVLSPEFTDRWAGRVINIHHGFLPAFKGAKPYHQAWRKGVKMIGATAHFVNEDLDQGPIISQDVIRVSDGSSIAELIRLGKDVERKVLLDALSLYLSRSVFVRDGRTFVLR
ncbi:MAG: formyltetrahydrofolate deformylase [Spirochaetae bacterium HGW-Spirochaetae-3]|jgi:formyltetrahydrofolate deformylase|nr:MAG: formyltetrahydrofolate deformylase [Spirochaetae bacterium HGW-Spirochaetae-3]